MACGSLLRVGEMPAKRPSERRASYVVLIHNKTAAAGELQELAAYLSSLGVAGCDVVVLDPSSAAELEANDSVLRWVSRHVPVAAEHCADGGVDIVRAASANAACDKVIVADEDVRYSTEAIGQMCDLLDRHEVVEPQDYPDPMPWWGAIDAGRILMHRAVEQQPDRATTFGFRRSALGALRGLEAVTTSAAQARRLAAVGAAVHPAGDVFVGRKPAPLSEWLHERHRQAGGDFARPFRTALFLALVPVLILAGILGSVKLAASFTSALAFGSIALAFRGRVGASSFFPLHACLFAPLWVFERSVSVYWALFRKLRGTDEDASRIAVPDRASGTRAASGE